MIDFNILPAHEIGRRLRVARQNANKRKSDVAEAIGLSDPSIVALEKGERSIRIAEIQRLASCYGLSLNNLMRREAVHVNLIPRFRRLQDSQSEALENAIKLLNNLVRAEVELENILGIKRTIEYPEERGISSGNVEKLGETHAQELRQWLGLGGGPIADIFSVIEISIGIRLFQRQLDTEISGLFVFDERVGACILLNSAHPVQRRTYSAAHELGHFIGTRHSPETHRQNEQFLSREERYADEFGRSFLTPQDSFSKAFNLIVDGNDRISRKHVIILANQFGISREFCIRRLEQLDLVRKGTWNWFQENGGISDKQAIDVLGEAFFRNDPAKSDASQPTSHRIRLMAHRAWEQELLSEGQLSELLCMDRGEFKRMMLRLSFDEGKSVDTLKLPSR